MQAIALTPESEPISIKYATCAFNGLPLIVGGTPASPGEFPFMVCVIVYKNIQAAYEIF